MIISIYSLFLSTFVIVGFAQQTPLGLSYDYLLRTANIDNPQVARFKQQIYLQNLKLVEQHNSNPNRTYNLTLNQFAIYSSDEIKAKVLTLVPSIQPATQLAKMLTLSSPLQTKHMLQSPERTLMNGEFFQSQPLNSQLNIQQTLETQVIKSLAQHLRARNKNNQQITDQIAKRKLDSNTTQIRNVVDDSEVVNKRRRLEEIENFDVDWTCASGEVRSQGACGACYAIAAADSLSAIMSIYYYGFYVPLSIQELIDCPKNSMTLGCDGGFIEGALAYMSVPGIVSEFAYPYSKISFESGLASKCRKFSDLQQRFKISDFKTIRKGDCFQLKKYLQNHPIAIGLAARRLLLYKQGIFNGCIENDIQDHAVLLIGYNQKKGWKIKNSWGTRWGQKGYAWIAQGQNGNNCRICNMAFFPIPEKGTKKHQTNKKLKQCPLK